MTYNSTSTKTYIFKKGATFCPSVQFIPVKGGLQSLTGAIVTCMVMDGNGDRHIVTATLQPDGLTVHLNAPASNTASWVVGNGLMDLRYVINGTEELTETLTFVIEEGITL